MAILDNPSRHIDLDQQHTRGAGVPPVASPWPQEQPS